jgi:carboxyl-terminal processing protease
MKLTKVVELIRGPKGTKVRLNIIPAADQSLRRTVVLVRDEIKLEAQEAKAKVVEEPGITKRLIGVVELPSFYAELPRAGKTNGFKSTTVDVSRLITKLKQEKVQGLILDLRGNGGGLLDEAIRLTGLFIKQGPVVQVRDPGGRVKADDDPDPSILYDGPLVVLTSRLSASASEILAAALQDYGRAVIVGDTSTFGKGTVQELIQLDPFFQQLGLTSTNLNAGTLRVTIRKFYRANGASTQLKGVTPDIVLPSLNSYAEVGESSLPNAMDWDTIDGTKFDAVNCVQACLPELRKRSTDRVAHDSDYAYLQEEIARYRKTLADKTISLNEAERRKEKDELDARQKARKNYLRALADPGRKVFELTLKTVDLPGLPPPVVFTNNVVAASAKAGTNTDDLESKADEAGPPEPDIALAETERILLDLISLTTAKPTLTGITTVTE